MTLSDVGITAIALLGVVTNIQLYFTGKTLRNLASKPPAPTAILASEKRKKILDL